MLNADSASSVDCRAFRQTLTHSTPCAGNLPAMQCRSIPSMSGVIPISIGHCWSFSTQFPQEQLVRPGQRRSLTRRALTGIVPDELLNRKRKAYVSVGLRETILTQWRQLNFNNEKPASAALGIVDMQGLVHTLDQVARGAEVPDMSLMRTLTMEAWLRAVLRRGVLDGSIAA